MMERFDLSLGTLSADLLGEKESWKAPLVEYGPRGGFESLRRALAQKEAVPADCVIITNGASMGLTATFATIDKSRAILLPRPYYPAYPNIARFLGLRLSFYDLRPHQRWVKAISAAVRERPTGAIVVNTPGNPLGNLASAEDIAELQEIGQLADALLVLDETYAGIVLDPVAESWTGIGAPAGMVRLKSLSKAQLLAGERIGYAIAETTIANQIEEAHWVLAMCPAITAQANAARALLGDGSEHLVDLCAQLRVSRDSALLALKQTHGIEVSSPAAGVFLWIEFPDVGRSGVDIARLCREQYGVTVMPGEACGQNNPPAIRASFARQEADAAKAFHLLARALSELPIRSQRQEG